MDPSPQDWSAAFLAQAKEDLRAAWAVQSANCPSTFAMLLQMVFEKLAKAAFAQSGGVPPRSHQVASRFFLLLRRHPAGQKKLQAWSHVEQFVRELEVAHPQVAKDCLPQLEYPWVDPATGQVRCPASDLPLVRRIVNPRDRIALDCLKFATALANDPPEIA